MQRVCLYLWNLAMNHSMRWVILYLKPKYDWTNAISTRSVGNEAWSTLSEVHPRRAASPAGKILSCRSSGRYFVRLPKYGGFWRLLPFTRAYRSGDQYSRVMNTTKRELVPLVPLVFTLRTTTCNHTIFFWSWTAYGNKREQLRLYCMVSIGTSNYKLCLKISYKDIIYKLLLKWKNIKFIGTMIYNEGNI